MFKNKISTLGFSLIELMITISISCLLLNCLMMVFLFAKKNYQAQLGLNSIQENLRTTSQLLSADIRLAGYIGCAAWTSTFPFKNDLPIVLSEKNKIEPYVTAEMKENTDGISVAHLSENSDYLIKDMRSYRLLTVDGGESFHNDDYLLISDCKTAEVFRVKSIMVKAGGLQEVTPWHPLKNKYLKHAQVGRFERNSYYIGKTDRMDRNGRPIYSLYMNDINAYKQEIIDHAEEMKIDIDVEEDGHLVKIPVQQIKEEAQIKGISIKLMVSAQEALSLGKTFYIYVALRQ